MYYVYVLRDNDIGEIYYGYTNNLERRIKEHNTNKNYKLIYYEANLSASDARKREMSSKRYGQSRAHLKNRISESLK